VAEQDFAHVARRTITRAIDEATNAGAATVEAEHLLLAIASDPEQVGDVLGEFGLDRESVETMLGVERERSLATAGITTVDAERLSSTTRRTRPGWGTSAREAILRGSRLRRRDRQRMSEGDLLAGILLADLGTVPRAFAFAGVDRAALVARLRAARPNAH
jgi:ATP-dependent Clp protease ATP-binding subunit ClpA